MRSIPAFAALALALVAAPALGEGKLLESRESLYNNIYVFEQGDLVIM